MGRRKGQQPRKLYLCLPGGSPKFVQVYHDMLDHDAYKDLTAKQKELHLYCLRNTHGKATEDDPSHDPRLFYMNKAQRTVEHRLYPPSDTRRFKHDMAALVSHGFVDCVRSGYATRTKSLYRLSSRWHRWGTESFELPNEVMTEYMLTMKRRGEPW